MKTGPDNPVMQKAAVDFEKHSKKTKKAVWLRISELLLRPSRLKQGVNLNKISRLCKDGDVVAVPVKILSLGTLNKKITIYTVGTTAAATAKITKAGSSVHKISALLDAKVDPSKVRIII